MDRSKIGAFLPAAKLSFPAPASCTQLRAASRWPATDDPVGEIELRALPDAAARQDRLTPISDKPPEAANG